MRKVLKQVGLIVLLVLAFPALASASGRIHFNSDLIGAEQSKFEQLILEIQNIKEMYPVSF